MIGGKFQSKMGKSAAVNVKKGEISNFLGGKFPPQKNSNFGLHTENTAKWGNQQVYTQSKRGNQQLFMYLRSQKGEISNFLGAKFLGEK